MNISKQTEEKIVELVEQLEHESIIELAKEALDSGMEPLHLLDLIAEGMVRVGKLYESRDYYIADLIMAGLIFKDVLHLDRMIAHFRTNPAGKIGTIIVGTVKGDIHDIGKDIFKGMLEVNGFEVIDLGVDVAKEVFVEKYNQYKPDIVGLSGILTTTIETMREVVDAFWQAGIRDKVKIVIGGNHITEEASQYIGADGFANDVSHGVKLCKEWVGITEGKEVFLND